MKVLNFAFVFQKSYKEKNIEYVAEQGEFSKKLSFYRKNKIVVRPFVIIEDLTKPSGNRWLKYTDYKKLKKEEEAV